MRQESQEHKIIESRGQKVVKSNDFIRNTRFNLSLQEQKIILYIISKIKPNDVEFDEYEFKLMDFCSVSGIQLDSGKNYKNLKGSIKTLSDKSVWIKNGDSERLLRWVYTAEITERSGVVKIRLSDEIKSYLLQLKEHYTQYDLIYTLAMRSQYSIRLYELLKSYEYLNGHEFTVEELRKKLNAENYDRFHDFRRFVLNVALQEINEITDLVISCVLKKSGRSYTKIQFIVSRKKGFSDNIVVHERIESRMNKQ